MRLVFYWISTVVVLVVVAIADDDAAADDATQTFNRNFCPRHRWQSV